MHAHTHTHTQTERFIPSNPHLKHLMGGINLNIKPKKTLQEILKSHVRTKTIRTENK
jgi:hypothetical protein